MVDKMREYRLSWLEHVFRRKDTEAVRLVKEIYVNEGEKTERKVGGVI